MQSILDQITEWLKEMLISGIMGNLSGMFDSVNQQVGEIAGDVGMTPASFSPAVFSLIRNISESVIVPIAGLILTFIACYELIQMIIEHNNLANFETWIFFQMGFQDLYGSDADYQLLQYHHAGISSDVLQNHNGSGAEGSENLILCEKNLPSPHSCRNADPVEGTADGNHRGAGR